MTIDEAINYYSNLANDIDKNPLPGDSSSELRQIAEWLEELKIFKELYPDTNIKGSLQKNYQQGRADAFNEILNEMRKSPFASDKAIFVKKYIEEQLKEQKNG